MQQSPDYHGYSPVHLLSVDPYLGSMVELQAMVGHAHALGLRVIMDMVLNHAGPVFEYTEPDAFGHAPKAITWTIPFYPTELAAPQHFKRRGTIRNWNSVQQVQRFASPCPFPVRCSPPPCAPLRPLREHAGTVRHSRLPIPCPGGLQMPLRQQQSRRASRQRPTTSI